MTRRSSMLPHPPKRRRRAVSPTRRVARGQTGPTFAPLGFAFFRLMAIGGGGDPGERQYAVVRVCEPRTTMAAFVGVARHA
jgi:hypothetical protein